MWHIYKNAEYVFIWLGDSKASDVGAVEMLTSFGPLAQRYKKQYADWEQKAIYLDEEWSKLPQKWPELGEFFSRPRFSRTWVIQEAANARVALMTFGNQGVWLHEVLEVAYAVCVWGLQTSMSSQAGKVEFVKGVGALRMLELIGKMQEHGRKEILDVLLVLHLSRGFKATDPKDKLFWVFGFLQDKYRGNLIDVDYSKSAESVFTTFSASYISMSGDLSILSYISCPIRKSSLNLPSWVPD